MQPALGDELQKRSIQSHHVGLLRARMRDDVAFQRVEHVLGRDLAQPREVAAVVRFLQAQEVAPGLLEKALDVEARRNIGDELAAVIRLHTRVPGKLRGRRCSHGLVAETGVLYLRSLSAPLRQQTHQSEHDGTGKQGRSEEHTSELQSQSNLVCRLLLEKKKKKQYS